MLFLLASRDSRRDAEGGIQWERSHRGDEGGIGQDADDFKVRTDPMRAKVSQGPYETLPVGANFLLTSGSGSITRRVRSGAPSCKDSLMRHPPHSVLLVSDALLSAVPPVFSARGATAECTVGHPVTSQWASLVQGFEPTHDRGVDQYPRTGEVRARRTRRPAARTRNKLPEADAGRASCSVQPGIDGRRLRAASGSRVQCRHGGAGHRGARGEHVGAPLRRPGRHVARRP